MNQDGARASTQVLFPGSYWYHGLRPGEVITGVTFFSWPEECGTQICRVWAKVDPTYLDVGGVVFGMTACAEFVDLRLTD